MINALNEQEKTHMKQTAMMTNQNQVLSLNLLRYT